MIQNNRQISRPKKNIIEVDLVEQSEVLIEKVLTNLNTNKKNRLKPLYLNRLGDKDEI